MNEDMSSGVTPGRSAPTLSTVATGAVVLAGQVKDLRHATDSGLTSPCEELLADLEDTLLVLARALGHSGAEVDLTTVVADLGLAGQVGVNLDAVVSVIGEENYANAAGLPTGWGGGS